jgi:hypothetical protein
VTNTGRSSPYSDAEPRGTSPPPASARAESPGRRTARNSGSRCGPRPCGTCAACAPAPIQEVSTARATYLNCRPTTRPDSPPDLKSSVYEATRRWVYAEPLRLAQAEARAACRSPNIGAALRMSAA